MNDDNYLIMGLDAMARAHSKDSFGGGHRGGALLSFYFLTQEIEFESGALEILRERIDSDWVKAGLFEALPAEPARSSELNRLIEAIAFSSKEMRAAGHNIILPALALKAFKQQPDLITTGRIDGLCKMIEAFNKMTDAPQDITAIPDIDPRGDIFSDFVLQEFIRGLMIFRGRGQGWTGHLLTHARALLDLRECGYLELAKTCEFAFKSFVARVRQGPIASDRQARPSATFWQNHPRRNLRPHQAEYWQQRRDTNIKGDGLGHWLKYPYAFYGVAKRCSDEALRQHAWDMYYVLEDGGG